MCNQLRRWRRASRAKCECCTCADAALAKTHISGIKGLEGPGAGGWDFAQPSAHQLGRLENTGSTNCSQGRETDQKIKQCHGNPARTGEQGPGATAQAHKWIKRLDKQIQKNAEMLLKATKWSGHWQQWDCCTVRNYIIFTYRAEPISASQLNILKRNLKENIYSFYNLPLTHFKMYFFEWKSLVIGTEIGIGNWARNLDWYWSSDWNWDWDSSSARFRLAPDPPPPTPAATTSVNMRAHSWGANKFITRRLNSA